MERMSDGDGQTEDRQAFRGGSEYEPPRVERVLGPEDLDREVHYAGLIGSVQT
jgi:hypothetical protein